jgi:hypothetical protein
MRWPRMTTRWLMGVVGVVALVLVIVPARTVPLTVSGRVFDAVTNQPIDRFRVILGTRQGRGVRWQGHRVTDHTGGASTCLRIRAPGNRPGSASRPTGTGPPSRGL